MPQAQTLHQYFHKIDCNLIDTHTVTLKHRHDFMQSTHEQTLLYSRCDHFCLPVASSYFRIYNRDGMKLPSGAIRNMRKTKSKETKYLRTKCHAKMYKVVQEFS